MNYSFYNLNSGTWQAPAQFVGATITTNLNVPFIAGSEAGFVISYIGTDLNLYGLAGTNIATDWSSPIPITTSGDVENQGSDWYSYPWYAGVAMVDDTVLFTWEDGTRSVQSQFYTINAPSSEAATRSFLRSSSPSGTRR
jgi:hypothetical protein